MSIDTTVAKSRRALLGAALGAAAASVANALGKPTPVRANDPNDVLLGGSNVASAQTGISNSTTSSTVLGLASYSPGSGYALSAYSDLNIAVFGHGYATNLPAVKGWASGESTGVYGYSGHDVPAAKAYTGVYGIADVGGSAGRGVFGECSLGIGVLGQSLGTGVGVRAHNTNNSGLALKVTGKAAFDRSGKLTVLAGQSSVTKSSISLTSSSLVLATLQSNVAGLYVQGVVTNPGGSAFTVYLSKAPAANVTVAWMAVN